MFLSQLAEIWYAPCTAPQRGAMVVISAPFTWFNATTGGLVLPPLSDTLWLAVLLARPTRLTHTQLSLGSALSLPLPPACSSRSHAI